MEIKRQYERKAVNAVLMPDLMSKYQSKIPQQCRTENDKELLVIPRYEVQTFSQSIAIDNPTDFLAFLKGSQEGPDRLEARLECLRQPGSIDPYKIEPPIPPVRL